MVLPEFKLVGLKLEHATTNKNGQSNIDCGALWQKFEKENVSEKMPERLDENVYAVYYDYGPNGFFTYFIGCKVDTGKTAPDDLDTLLIPEQNYKKITARGKMPDCISDSWKEIWKSESDRAFGFDFELYDERSKNWNNAEVDIFISEKKF